MLFGEIAGKAGRSTCDESAQAWSSQIDTGPARREEAHLQAKPLMVLFSSSMGRLSQLGSGRHSAWCWVKLCHGCVACPQVKEKLLVELLQVHVSSAVPGN